MSENKPYAVIFSGEVIANADPETVKGNLVLDVGIPEQKAEKLFGRGSVMLKRFATLSDAESLADKFYQAGALCHVRDYRQGDDEAENAISGESSLVRMFKHFTGSTRSRAEVSSTSRT